MGITLPGCSKGDPTQGTWQGRRTSYFSYSQILAGSLTFLEDLKEKLDVLIETWSYKQLKEVGKAWRWLLFDTYMLHTKVWGYLCLSNESPQIQHGTPHFLYLQGGSYLCLTVQRCWLTNQAPLKHIFPFSVKIPLPILKILQSLS